jgi:acetoin utilization deacetylase AcuC-like enzyme
MTEPSGNRERQTDAPPTRAALLRSRRFQGHDTGSHPENPGRTRAIDTELERTGLSAGRPEVPFGLADLTAVERVHDPRYVAGIQGLAASGGAWLDSDTMVAADSVEVALLAVGAALAATDAVLAGQVRRAFVLARPPGHHATPGRGMGFCLFNGVAIAAAHALAQGLERVLILDWDVHHGNGTQDAFYDTDRILFCSVHQSPFYPGTGAASEEGTGTGRGFTINVPLRAGQDDAVYRAVFDERFLPAARTYRPELILISAGFDAHGADPLGGMRVTEDGFADLARRVTAAADDLCDGRVVAILEGGYDPRALGRSVAAVLRVLDDDNGRPEAREGERNR